MLSIVNRDGFYFIVDSQSGSRLSPPISSAPVASEYRDALDRGGPPSEEESILSPEEFVSSRKNKNKNMDSFWKTYAQNFGDYSSDVFKNLDGTGKSNSGSTPPPPGGYDDDGRDGGPIGGGYQAL